MTEQTEWRSGDVRVTHDLKDWSIEIGDQANEFFVSKKLTRDPQALAEFIDSQQPQPRYYTYHIDDLPWRVIDDSTTTRSQVAICHDEVHARLIVKALNEHEVRREQMKR